MKVILLGYCSPRQATPINRATKQEESASSFMNEFEAMKVEARAGAEAIVKEFYLPTVTVL